MHKPSKYEKVILKLFNDRFRPGYEKVIFTRDDIENAAADLKIPRPKNLGDVVYSYRYRKRLPEGISNTAPEGKEWYIKGEGGGLYASTLKRCGRYY